MGLQLDMPTELGEDGPAERPAEGDATRRDPAATGGDRPVFDGGAPVDAGGATAAGRPGPHAPATRESVTGASEDAPDGDAGGAPLIERWVDCWRRGLADG